MRNIVILLLLLVSAWTLVLIAVKSVTKPLLELSTKIKMFRDGDYNARVMVYTKDEIGDAGEVFNSMATTIQDLIVENYQKTIKERKVEIEALYARINPHFLYNTLDSIYWTARSDGSEDSARMIHSLSELFRSNLSSGLTMIPLQKEITILEHYFRIQSLRIGSKLEIKLQVDPGTESLMVPRMMLQPLVENSFVHGFNQKQERYFVGINIRIASTDLEFTVIDNGIGIDDGELCRLNNHIIKEQNSYKHAITNLKSRLDLLYNDKACLNVASNQPSGTIITIRIPAIGEEVIDSD